MNPPDLAKIYHLRWRAVVVSFLLTFGLAGAALAGVWNQNQTLDNRVQTNLERGHQIERAVDSVRVPVCAILYAALSRTPAGLTPQQMEARVVYAEAYGPGTAKDPGLNCPNPLPVPGR